MPNCANSPAPRGFRDGDTLSVNSREAGIFDENYRIIHDRASQSSAFAVHPRETATESHRSPVRTTTSDTGRTFRGELIQGHPLPRPVRHVVLGQSLIHISEPTRQAELTVEHTRSTLTSTGIKGLRSSRVLTRVRYVASRLHQYR